MKSSPWWVSVIILLLSHWVRGMVSVWMTNRPYVISANHVRYQCRFEGVLGYGFDVTVVAGLVGEQDLPLFLGCNPAYNT